MIKRIGDYFARLAEDFGQGWTRFWFTPSDAATVSAIRLLTGLVVVCLHATLSLDLIAFFGVDGLLPVADISPLEAPTFSYLNYLSTAGELWSVHLMGLAVLVMFAAGLWTRVTSVLALVVFLSDVNRAPMITTMAESIVAMVMLYLCFAPCGARYSLDALLARRKPRVESTSKHSAGEPSTMSTIATRLIQVHLALIVAMMGFSMLAGEVWWNGTGVWWLIGRPESRLVDLTGLYANPLALDAWTHLIVIFAVAFGVLIWVPAARPLLLVLGAIVWTSLALLTGDVPFAVMMITASLAFVSPQAIAACCPTSSAAAA